MTELPEIFEVSLNKILVFFKTPNAYLVEFSVLVINKNKIGTYSEKL